MGDASTSAGGADTPALTDLVTMVKERRESMLLALATADDGLNTQELRERGEVPQGSMGYHTDKLEEWALVERVGKEPLERGGSDAWVWELTERGETFVEEYLAPGLDSVDDLIDRVHSLTERVETLEEELAQEREERKKAQELLLKHAAGIVELDEEKIRARFEDGE